MNKEASGWQSQDQNPGPCPFYQESVKKQSVCKGNEGCEGWEGQI